MTISDAKDGKNKSTARWKRVVFDLLHRTTQHALPLRPHLLTRSNSPLILRLTLFPRLHNINHDRKLRPNPRRPRLQRVRRRAVRDALTDFPHPVLPQELHRLRRVIAHGGREDVRHAVCGEEVVEVDLAGPE